MNLTFDHENGAVALRVERTGTENGAESLTITLPDGTTRPIRVRRLPGDVLEIADGDRIFRVSVMQGERGAVSLSWQGQAYSFTPRIGEARRGGDGTGSRGGKRSGVLAAPMVGIVAAVNVAVGDTVAVYQPVVVVEAMKVLATIEAPFAGVVQTVNVRKGDRVEHGAALVEIVPPEADGVSAES